jgi:hypothetical protein
MSLSERPTTELAEDRIAALRAAFPPGGLFAHKHWNYSPEPLALDRGLVAELEKLGHRLYVFQRAANEIYHRSVSGSLPGWIAAYLDAGKPGRLIEHGRSRKLRDAMPRVIRPDLILTDGGFAITELDNLPGGIGLTAWLNETYAGLSSEWEVIGGADGMFEGFQSVLPGDKGKDIIVSEESSDYRPEMDWLAARLRERGGDWKTECAEDYVPGGRDVYRFYELFDLENVPPAEAIFAGAEQGEFEVSPPYKAFLEEKLWAGLFWLAPLRKVWNQTLRSNQFKALRKHFPYSWIIDPAPLPHHAVLPRLEVNSWEEVKHLSQKERELVLKISGFSELAWGSRSVKIGDDLPQIEWAQSIDRALDDFGTNPWVMQEFKKGRVVEHPYWDEGSGRMEIMKGRVRLCPYYFLNPSGKPTTRLAGVLATIVPADKKIIHGMRDGILVPCRVAG